MPSIANDGTKLYLTTDKNAPLTKVITIDLADNHRKHTLLIPEDSQAKLAGISVVNDDYAVLTYKRNVRMHNTRLSHPLSDPSRLLRSKMKYTFTDYLQANASVDWHRTILVPQLSVEEEINRIFSRRSEDLRVPVQSGNMILRSPMRAKNGKSSKLLLRRVSIQRTSIRNR